MYFNSGVRTRSLIFNLFISTFVVPYHISKLVWLHHSVILKKRHLFSKENDRGNKNLKALVIAITPFYVLSLTYPP